MMIYTARFSTIEKSMRIVKKDLKLLFNRI